MDWNLAIEKNRDALKRTLVMLVAVAGFSVLPTGTGAGTSGVRHTTLPRHLHRFVLRLLRPAEAAARRLIIIAARGLVVELPPPRIAKPKPKPALNRSNGFGTGVVIRPGPLPEWARALAPKRSSTVSLPLLDPHKRFGARRHVKQRDVPRIRSFDDPRVSLFQPPRAPDPLPRSPDDPLDAGRLHRRLDAVGRALDDLPHQAKRLARWRARLERASIQSRSNDAAGAQGGNTGGIRRLSPMRPGHPPGWRRRPSHAVDEVLNELHGLAVWARESPDTS